MRDEGMRAANAAFSCVQGSGLVEFGGVGEGRGSGGISSAAAGISWAGDGFSRAFCAAAVQTSSHEQRIGIIHTYCTTY